MVFSDQVTTWVCQLNPEWCWYFNPKFQALDPDLTNSMQNHGAQQAMFIAAITFGVQSDMSIMVHIFPMTYPESLLKRPWFETTHYYPLIHCTWCSLEKPLLHVQRFKKVFEMEAEIEMGVLSGSLLWRAKTKTLLGGGFKCFLCSPLFGEDSHVD